MSSTEGQVSQLKRPWGLKWRSSVWFITFIVGLGVTVDLLVYSIVIPVLPFRLEALGYSGVSALVGWLLFGYSGGLVISTPPIAALSEKYHNRKYPLLAGQVFLIGSQILLMEAPKYWVMVLARVIQGISSSMIWVVGLALICDTVPEKVVGRQLGIAMTGLSLGILIGPPVGGALYSRFGFRGPFILAIIITAIDLIGRLVIIEREEAERFCMDDPVELGTMAVDQDKPSNDEEKWQDRNDTGIVENDRNQASAASASAPIVDPDPTPQEVPPLSLVGVVRKLLGSPRALAVILSTLVYGIVYSSQEPAVPLFLQAVWGLNSSKVGLVYLAAVIPTLFSSPLAGWWADRKGTEWITVVIFLSSIPWWIFITIRSSLAFFIVMFAFESFFTAAVVSPLTAELAAVSRTHVGVGYAHVYGAFNLSYGIGAARPIIGGQMYSHLGHGWTAICLLATGLLAMSAILAICFTGERPLLRRVLDRFVHTVSA